MPDGENRGTFRSYTVFIGADDVTAEHLTFVNSAGDGRVVGQALAVYARVAFINCWMDARVPWATILTDDEARQYTVDRVLSGQDGWSPQLDVSGS
jgi:hypothetical protein